MLQRMRLLGSAISSVVLLAACSQSPETLVSPSAASGSATANPDGSTLKVTAPVIVSPRGGDQVDTRRPDLVFTNATAKFTAAALQYRLETFDAAGTFLGARLVPQGTGSQSTFPSEVDLAYDTVYAWRVRAEFDGQAGPWSATESFKSPVRPAAGGPVTGGVGPQRSINYPEAAGIIINIHNTLRIDLGSRSTREFRIDFLNAAVAAIHYGHPRFNAAGPDPSWCVKDAGGGRPQSDDVLVLCQSRDAWDLIASAGGNGYFFHDDYLGKLPGGQNIYPPPVSALNFLNR